MPTIDVWSQITTPRMRARPWLAPLLRWTDSTGSIRAPGLFMRLIIGLLLASATVAASAEPAAFHARVAGLYSFSPHTLDAAAIEAKSSELDVFWTEVKASGPSGLEDLRHELARPDASPFFDFDGAKLLLALSKEKADRALALAAMSRADLRDIQRDDYFRTIHWFAVEGYDTTDAAFKILSEPGFKVFIPQHSLTLDQEMSLNYLLLPTREDFYLEKAEKRLFVEKDITAQKSLLGLIANTVTRSGDETLARFAAAPDQPAASRQYARMIIETTKQMESSALLGLSLSSYESLKEEQRRLFARVSDEALLDWEHLRVKIRRKSYR